MSALPLALRVLPFCSPFSPRLASLPMVSLCNLLLDAGQPHIKAGGTILGRSNVASVLGRHHVPGSWGYNQVSAPIPSLGTVLGNLSSARSQEVFCFLFFFFCSYSFCIEFSILPSLDSDFCPFAISLGSCSIGGRGEKPPGGVRVLFLSHSGSLSTTSLYHRRHFLKSLIHL